MSPSPRPLPPRASVAAVAPGLAGALAGCAGASAPGADADSASNAGSTTVTIAKATNGAGTEPSVTVPRVASIRAELPASIRSGGTLTIGVGNLPAGFP